MISATSASIFARIGACSSSSRSLASMNACLNASLNRGLSSASPYFSSISDGDDAVGAGSSVATTSTSSSSVAPPDDDETPPNPERADASASDSGGVAKARERRRGAAARAAARDERGRGAEERDGGRHDARDRGLNGNIQSAAARLRLMTGRSAASSLLP